MKIGVLSDTHNHADNTRRALEILRERRVERLIHCGDVTSATTISLFEGWDAAFVLGNMDHNATALADAVRRLGGASIGEQFADEIDGVRLAACHGHDSGQLREMIASGLYQYVFHGHTHTRRDEMAGQTRVINPGALGGTHRQSRSVCIIDLQADRIEFVELEGQ